MSRPRRKAVEFITDPSSGQLSASRLLLMVLILIYLPALLVLDAYGIKFGSWAQFAIIVSSVAGIYWFNSTARVWRDGVCQPKSPPTKEGSDG